MPQPPESREDIEAASLWLIKCVSEFRARSSSRGDLRSTDWTPAEGSSLAADDRATDPFQVSHAAKSAAVVAADYLSCLLDLVVDGAGTSKVSIKTRPYALYGLLRGGFENAATSVWLLESRNGSERTRRRLWQALADAKNAEKARGGHGKSGHYAKREAQVFALARKAGVVIPKRAPQYVDVVGAAGASFDMGARTAELIWRALSGAAHGDQWALTSLVTSEILRESGGVIDAVQTTDVSKVAPLTSLVLRMLDEADRLYSVRSRPDVPAPRYGQ